MPSNFWYPMFGCCGGGGGGGPVQRCRMGGIVVVMAAGQCSVLLSWRRSLAVSCHSRAPVAVVDASPHPYHTVHAGIIRCCHLHAAGAAETADDLD